MKTDNFYTVCIVIAAILILLCLIRAIQGPKIADRIVAVNMIGTMTIVTICILAVKMGEEYLVDVALIYAMISFLAVIVITKVLMGAHKEKLEADIKAERILIQGEKKEGDRL